MQLYYKHEQSTVGTNLDVLELNSFMDIWSPEVGEMLILKAESYNPIDVHMVAVLWEGQIVGHIPYNLAPTLKTVLAERCHNFILKLKNLHKELDIWKVKATDSKQIIDQSSSQIKSAIKEDNYTYSLVNHPSYGTHSTPLLECFVFFMWRIQQDSSPVIHSGYDICCNIGETIITKTSTTSICCQNSNRNAELIQTLNNFWHGVPYSQLEENDKVICLQKLATNSTKKNCTSVLHETLCLHKTCMG